MRTHVSPRPSSLAMGGFLAAAAFIVAVLAHPILTVAAAIVA